MFNMLIGNNKTTFELEKDPFGDGSQVAFYPFNTDFNSIVTEGYNLAAFGATTIDTFGKIHSSCKSDNIGASFSVDTMYSVPVPTMQQVQDLSERVSCWWYSRDHSATRNHHLISRKHTNGYFTFGFVLYGGDLLFRYRTSATGTIISRTVYTAFPTSQWVHLAWFRSSSNIWTIYLNNSLIDTFTATPHEDTTRGGVQHHGWNSTEPFNGYMDSYRVFNRVLSLAEVQAIYNKELVL